MPALLTSAVERAERGRRLEQPHDVGFDGHVGLDRDGAAAGAADGVDDRVGRVALDAVVDAHGVAARGGEAGSRGADAAAAAGDEQHASHR